MKCSLLFKQNLILHKTLQYFNKSALLEAVREIQTFAYLVCGAHVIKVPVGNVKNIWKFFEFTFRSSKKYIYFFAYYSRTSPFRSNPAIRGIFLPLNKAKTHWLRAIRHVLLYRYDNWSIIP